MNKRKQKEVEFGSRNFQNCLTFPLIKSGKMTIIFLDTVKKDLSKSRKRGTIRFESSQSAYFAKMI